MGQSDPVTHLVNISTIIMNSVKCVAAALMLASSVVNGARVRRDDGYGAPQEDTYGAPAESYGASAPSYGAAAETGLDLTTIIIPLLALLGLFLLFPTYVTLTSVRRKREAIDDSEVSVNAVERMMDMYQAVIESEECLERVACDVGAMASEPGLHGLYHGPQQVQQVHEAVRHRQELPQDQVWKLVLNIFVLPNIVGRQKKNEHTS